MEKFADLYGRHYEKVFRLCLVHLCNSDQAMDIAQEAFLRAFERLETLRDENAFLPWVNTIAMNIIRNWAVRERCRCLPWPEMAYADFDLYPHAEDMISKHLDRMELRRALIRMPYSAQQVLLLRYFYDLSEKEIAAVLEVPQGTVKSKLYRARGMLADLLEKGISPPQDRNFLPRIVSYDYEARENRRDWSEFSTEKIQI